MIALKTEALSFQYGDTVALSDVSLAVPVGRFTVLLGANGAGKTTLFSIVTGLYAARSGRVAILSHDLRNETLKALRHIGVVFQKTTLDLDLSVFQNLRYAAALQGLSRAEARTRIAESMDTHGLSELASRKVIALSGGQRRRVELARALLHRPSLLLLDEPTVGLDLQSRQDFVAHVRELCADGTTGVLWATHLMDEVDDSDAVVMLHRGKIIAEGDVQSLKQQHGQSSVTELFKALQS